MTWFGHLGLALVPAAACLLGGALIVLGSPGYRLESGIQHFAGGAVLAAVAELLADLEGHDPGVILAGLVGGVAFVLVVESGTDVLEERASERSISAVAGLLLAMGLDTLLDGFLAGVLLGALAGGGLVLVLAFAVEMLTFGLAAGAALPNAVSSSRLLGTTAALGVVFPVGMLLGDGLATTLSGATVGFVVAVGVSVLVYLVTDELLAEAREEYASTGTLLAFFAGFVLLYGFALFSGGA